MWLSPMPTSEPDLRASSYSEFPRPKHGWRGSGVLISLYKREILKECSKHCICQLVPLPDTVKFRGCAGVQYADPFHECVRRKQPVPVDSQGQRSVDVDVALCYCNEDLCNEVLNGASRDGDTAALVSAISCEASLTAMPASHF